MLLEWYRAGTQNTPSGVVAQKFSTTFWDPPDFRHPCSNMPWLPGHYVLLWTVIRCLHHYRPNNSSSSSEGAEKQASEFWIYLPIIGALPTDYTWVCSQAADENCERILSHQSSGKNESLGLDSILFHSGMRLNKNQILLTLFEQSVVQTHTCFILKQCLTALMQNFDPTSPLEYHCHGMQDQLEFQAQERVK